MRDQLQLEVLGARASSEICLYARGPRQVAVYSIESLTAVRLSHLAGLPVHQLLHRANLSIANLKEYVAQASASHPLDGAVPRGAGLYRDDTQLLIVSGNQAYRWDGRQKTPIQSPLYKQYMLELHPGFPLIPHLDDLLREAPRAYTPTGSSHLEGTGRAGRTMAVGTTRCRGLGRQPDPRHDSPVDLEVEGP